MANLGRVAYVNRGTYNAEALYEKYDVVYDSVTNSAYAYINNTAETNKAVTNTDYWAVMVSGSELNSTASNMPYLFIKYSENNPTADGDMSDSSGDWMGIYVGTSHTAPTTYTSYTWHNITGVHIGDDAPAGTEKLWIDTDEPDLLAIYDDMVDATVAANASGPVSSSRTSGDGTPGSTDTYTVVHGNGNTTSFNVYNGADAPALSRVKQYIIRWDKVNSQCTRMGDASAITTTTTNFTHNGTVNAAYSNPFDNLYPWKYRKLVKVDRVAYAALASGAPITDAVTMWEGEPGFTLDGTGDFDGVYTPEFWANQWEDATYVYIGVADGAIPGWKYFEATIGGRYFGSMDGASNITSIAGSIPLRNTRMDTMHANVTAQKLTLDDIFTWCADTVLMAVEFACLNSQQVLGSGVDALYRQTAGEVVGENASTGATVIKLPNDFVAACVVGAVIGLGTSTGGEQTAITTFVSSAALDGEDPLFATHKAVTISPALTANVTTDTTICIHGAYNAPDIAIGSKSGYLGINGKSNAYYRGRIAHANFWRYVLGAYRETLNGRIWVATSRTQAAAYDALNTDVHRNTNLILPEASNYIASLNMDALLPLAPFAKTTGGTAGSADPVGDYYYVPSLATGDAVLRVGGLASAGVACGRFYGGWYGGASDSYWSVSVLPFLQTP